MSKFYPQVGDKLYLSQRTGRTYVDMVKIPYTVIKVEKKYIYVQSCKLIFNGDVYFDTLPDDIIEDPNGEIKKLTWRPKKEMWAIDEFNTGYPEFAFFGKWEYFPYLD